MTVPNPSRRNRFRPYFPFSFRSACAQHTESRVISGAVPRVYYLYSIFNIYICRLRGWKRRGRFESSCHRGGHRHGSQTPLPRLYDKSTSFNPHTWPVVKCYYEVVVWQRGFNAGKAAGFSAERDKAGTALRSHVRCHRHGDPRPPTVTWLDHMMGIRLSRDGISWWGIALGLYAE